MVLGCKKFFRNSLSSASPLLSKINLINSLSSSLKSGFNLKIVSRSKILFFGIVTTSSIALTFFCLFLVIMITETNAITIIPPIIPTIIMFDELSSSFTISSVVLEIVLDAKKIIYFS